MAATNIIEQIPDPHAIRQRLADNLREAELLRRLLKIAERKQRFEQVAGGGQACQR